MNGRQLIRARHPNGNAETDLWPTGGYIAQDLVPRQKIVSPMGWSGGTCAWMPPPAWQTEPQTVEIREPNYNDDGVGFPRDSAQVNCQGGRWCCEHVTPRSPDLGASTA